MHTTTTTTTTNYQETYDETTRNANHHFLCFQYGEARYRQQQKIMTIVIGWVHEGETC